MPVPDNNSYFNCLNSTINTYIYRVLTKKKKKKETQYFQTIITDHPYVRRAVTHI